MAQLVVSGAVRTALPRVSVQAGEDGAHSSVLRTRVVPRSVFCFMRTPDAKAIRGVFASRVCPTCVARPGVGRAGATHGAGEIHG